MSSQLSALLRGFGKDVWERRILPRLPDYMGLAFEEIRREHVRDHAQERLGVPAGEVGRVWGKDFEIDIAGPLLDGAAIFGECKWENTLVGEAVRSALLASIARTSYAADARSRRTLFFSRKGFTQGLRQIAKIDGSVHLFRVDELVLARCRPPRSALLSRDRRGLFRELSLQLRHLAGGQEPVEIARRERSSYLAKVGEQRAWRRQPYSWLG
jgi:Archaea bacterial proteins of unknown function